MKLSELLEAKLPKWEVELEVGPHQFITLSVNAASEEDAMKKAVALAIKQSHRSPTPSSATKIVEGTRQDVGDQAVMQLKTALLAKKKHINSLTDSTAVYKVIDEMMTQICKVHKLTGKQLHNLWVEKYTEIPDDWIMNQ